MKKKIKTRTQVVRNTVCPSHRSGGGHDGAVGALVTLDLATDSPILAMPWIITFGPLSDDEDWEPVVCGPYERPHALAIAEEVVADEELMAVVEPLMSFTSVSEIRGEIEAARAVAAETGDDIVEELEDDELEFDEDADLEANLDHHEEVVLPSPDEVRAGMARIAHRIAEAN